MNPKIKMAVVPPRFSKPALLALAGMLSLAPVARAADFAMVLKVVGPVDFRHDKVWKPATKGTELSAGDSLRTGDKGYATVRDVRGAVTDLYPLTTLAITQDSELSVEAGRIWSHFLHVLGLPRQIRTPDAVAMIRGTTLSVAVAGHEDSVTVLEGHVEVRTRQGLSTMVNGGFSVDVDHGALGTILPADPALLEQGRAFLKRAIPLLEGQSMARPQPPAPGKRQGPDGSRGAPPRTAVRGHLPDAEQRAEAEWDTHRLGLGHLSHAPAQSPVDQPGRRPADRQTTANGAGLGIMGHPGAVPPIVGEGDRTRNLSVERMERPLGAVNPEGLPVAGFEGRGTAGGGSTGAVPSANGVAGGPNPSIPGPTNSNTQPVTTSQSLVAPLRGAVEHVNSLVPAPPPKGISESGTK